MNNPSSWPKPLEQVVRPTSIIDGLRLARRLGRSVLLASEAHQHTGSFRFQVTYSVASRVAPSRLLTVSSGNFGRALACACQLLGKSCQVVMPGNSAAVKVQAVREFGGTVWRQWWRFRKGRSGRRVVCFSC